MFRVAVELRHQKTARDKPEASDLSGDRWFFFPVMQFWFRRVVLHSFSQGLQWSFCGEEEREN